MNHLHPDVFKGEDVFLDVLAEKVAQNLERRQSGELIGIRVPPPLDCDPATDSVSVAQRMIAMRRHREAVLGSNLFGEPAWDIMLDLFVAGAKNKLVSISSACIAANVPPTTALRWIKIMVERGIICRTDDPFDNRRKWVSLSTEWQTKIHLLLSDLVSGSSEIPPARQ